ncbi:MAG TPA: EAL domain-containing protein [Verrucomicrobiae bacterium]|nr:EAL domain-containing protein [Verrucomicrobiae bacterium]
MIDEREVRILDDVLARSPLALVTFDREFRFSHWSDRAAAMFGYDASEMLGRRPEQTPLVLPEDAPNVELIAARVGAGSTDSLTLISRNVRKDGSLRICRWSTVAVQPHDRYASLALGEDITNEVDARAALVESEGRFRALFESNPETIVFLDLEGNIVDANAAVSVFGAHVTREAILGKNFRDWLRLEDVPRHEEFFRRSVGGESLSYDARAVSFTGRTLELAVTAFPITRDGIVAGVFCIVRDQTSAREAERRIERQEHALAESEARLRSLFEHNPDPVLAIDLDGIMTACNDAATRVSGLPRESIVGSKYDRFLPATLRPHVEAAFSHATSGKPSAVTFEIVNAEGRRIEVDGTIIPQYSQGRIVGIYAIFQDATDRRVAERRAEMQRRRIRDLYFIATGGMRHDERIASSLEMGARAFGLGAAAVVEGGASPAIYQLYRTYPNSRPTDAELLAMGAVAGSASAPGAPTLSPRGVATRLDVAGEPFGGLVFAGDAAYDFTETDADLLGLIATLIAGSIENERVRTRLRTLAYYDALTGLPNRALLAERVRDAIEVAQSRLSRAALLMLDLDGFKDVNDTLGHARGDQLLRLVAGRLLKLVGDRGTVARMGSDEFVVLFTETADADAAREAAEEIIGLLSEPFALDDYEQFISASVGIALYPDDGRDDGSLVKNADIAMSHAKSRGRNGYFFYNPTLEAPIHLRLSQEKLLRRALDLHEFVVYYQPQLDLRTQRVVSVEALVRWNHPKSGLIEPGHFIPSAEISGLIVPLGDWVLATAVKQLREWHRTLGPLRLAVNLSGRQFHDRDLRSRILGALAEGNLAPEYLEVEITESVAMADAAQTADILHDLTASGIRIAVDDFGTGYSSLAYLRQFELDVLKVDGSFVKGIGRTSSDETIVNTIVGMAHSLDLEVIAEGVETTEQLAFLTAKGCDVVQGFAIAPAMPASELEAFLIRRREAATASGYRT